MADKLEITGFNFPSAVVLDPVAQVRSRIESQDRERLDRYNALVSEVRTVRNELSACVVLERELPARIASLNRQLQQKLTALQTYINQSVEKGWLLKL